MTIGLIVQYYAGENHLLGFSFTREQLRQYKKKYHESYTKALKRFIKEEKPNKVEKKLKEVSYQKERVIIVKIVFEKEAIEKLIEFPLF